jgi:diaminopimelate epimerase
MQTIDFYKYQGTGNDFVMIDDRDEAFDPNDHALIAHLCDRKFGIGADGLILIRNHDEADFEMIYYNADGHLTSLCGNGSRCAVKFASQLGMVAGECSFMTVEGILRAKIEGKLVHIKMPDVTDVETHPDHYFLNTGSPHHICYVNDIEKYDVFHEGRKIRQSSPYFEKGSNVNFVEPMDNSAIFVRTYERGVEDETLSCGTGVTAAALVQGVKGASSPVKVKTLGGDLQISFQKMNDGSFTDIYLIGPAVRVFRGEYQVNT